MEEQKQRYSQESQHNYYDSKRRNFRDDNIDKKAVFWQKVKEVRYEHRDRSKDQEVLGLRDNKHQKVPLNKQMGFKSRLRIGQSNPSKKIHETKPQRTRFDIHEDGTECVQADQMKLKSLIDLTEVTCQGFDKVIHTKKGWISQTTRMMTIVCCPSTRRKIEKALIKRFHYREQARNRGSREWELWSERQENHWREINESWEHESLMPGRHIQENTMEVCLRQIEEAQFSEEKISHMIISPVVMNDKGVIQIERVVGSTNWKMENGKFWREEQDIRSIIIPISCQSSIKGCRNWIVLRITKGSGAIEVFDARRNVGSLALIQKHQKQIILMITEIMGKDFKADKIVIRNDTNQVSDPEDCGVMAILITNHLALELEGEPIFQIFAKDWVNMQRYYLLYNLEVGLMKLEIGKSGITVEDQTMELIRERRNEALWHTEESGTQNTNIVSQVDVWDEMVLENGIERQMELLQEEQEEKFSEIAEEGNVVEEYLLMQRGYGMEIEPNLTGGARKPKLVQTPHTDEKKISESDPKQEARDQDKREQEESRVKGRDGQQNLNEEEDTGVQGQKQ
ncbi:hypothetical protein OXYTRIMIC_316 [Oxytricha trifallax]|uniref:Uncharacterized protein n=1 Tax=Oxytricha trifallax TaxID=1172189 RepID=A0A073HYC8_9SPIT|nr:hypothetical protein OXYTRIMIC_316 [Oxytricha trifallax]